MLHMLEVGCMWKVVGMWPLTDHIVAHKHLHTSFIRA